MLSIKDVTGLKNNRSFFLKYRKDIIEYDKKTLGLIEIVMLCVTSLYYIISLIYDRNVYERSTYMLFSLFFLAICAYHRHAEKKDHINLKVSITFIYELVFVFLLFAEPVFRSGELSCFIPVFFVVSPLLLIVPTRYTEVMTLINLTVFAMVTSVFKSSPHATSDIADAASCAVIGLVLGRHILIERMSQLKAYSTLKQASETKLSNALELANKDPLTGVKSRAAYENTEEELNQIIDSGRKKQLRFAVAVCDVNNLKQTNDILGHEAGDELLVNASRDICKVFSHSPVFRIGGDEFAVILRDSDYDNRRYLAELVKKPVQGSVPRVASGMADFSPAEDSCVNDVFVRADKMMYEHKKMLKAERK